MEDRSWGFVALSGRAKEVTHEDGLDLSSETFASFRVRDDTQHTCLYACLLVCWTSRLRDG